MLARAGLEFRNDLLGHVHGLGLTGVPEVLHTGHEGTDHPWDWPPNSVVCADLQQLNAVTTYAHPVFAPGEDPGDLFTRSAWWRRASWWPMPPSAWWMRSSSCRASTTAARSCSTITCSPADFAWPPPRAPTPSCPSPTGPAPASNPPGWGRVYARLGQQKLTVEAFADAIRAGRTVVTNGPWLTIDVDGHGPGTVLNATPGDRLRVRAHVIGSGVRRLVLYGPDGELAATASDLLEHEVVLGKAGSWLAAAAHGDNDPHTVGAPVFAHTSPVYVDVAGQRVARTESAR